MNNEQYIIHYYPLSYRQGYNSYISWSYNGGEKPTNPFDPDHADELSDYTHWQNGWDDASIDSADLI